MKERQTKTKIGLTIDARQATTRLWSNGFACDPVSAYRFYAAKRPHGFGNPSDPLYLATRTTPLSNSNDQWFLSPHMCLTKIGITIRGRKSWNQTTPHQPLGNKKKQLVQSLRDSKQASADIMQISVHKNLQSITNYSSMSLESQKLQNFERLLSSKRPSVSSTLSKHMHVSKPAQCKPWKKFGYATYCQWYHL